MCFCLERTYSLLVLNLSFDVSNASFNFFIDSLDSGPKYSFTFLINISVTNLAGSVNKFINSTISGNNLEAILMISLIKTLNTPKASFILYQSLLLDLFLF